MADAEVEDRFEDSILAAGCVQSAPLREGMRLSCSICDVLLEEAVRSCLRDFMSGPVDRLVEQVPVADRPKSPRISIRDQLAAFRAFQIRKQVWINSRHCSLEPT